LNKNKITIDTFNINSIAQFSPWKMFKINLFIKYEERLTI
jgi:hypothetical protein